MNKIKSENYIVIQGWMISELNLKGNELLIYAIIYGFSQAEDQYYSGSLKYLEEWTNSTQQSVSRCLKSLIQKNYIIKKEEYINNVKFCKYNVNKSCLVDNKVVIGRQQSCLDGGQQSCHNNININNIDINNVIDKNLNEQFEKFWSVYPRKDTKVKSEEWFNKHKVSDELLEIMINKIEQFKKTDQWKNKKFIPQPITWLNQSRWEDEVLTEEKEDSYEQQYTRW